MILCKSLILKNLPRMDSNHDKVIQSHLCYRYTTRHKGGKLAYHIPGKSQANGMQPGTRSMTNDKLQMTDWEGTTAARKAGVAARIYLEDAGTRLGASIGLVGSSPTKELAPLRNPFGYSGASPHQSEASAIFAFATCYLLFVPVAQPSASPTRFVICYLSFVIAA